MIAPRDRTLSPTGTECVQALAITKETVNKALDDKVFRLAAALSYYSIFLLAPLVLIVIAVAGAVFGEDAASGVLAQELASSIGANAAVAVQEMVARTRTPSTNVVASATGIALLIIGATGVFAALQDALNTVWCIKPKPGRVFAGLFRDRIRSFSMILGIGFLLLISLILTTTLQVASDYIARLVDVPAAFWSLLGSAIAFVVVAVLFAAIFTVRPDARIEWAVGAPATAGRNPRGTDHALHDYPWLCHATWLTRPREGQSNRTVPPCIAGARHGRTAHRKEASLERSLDRDRIDRRSIAGVDTAASGYEPVPRRHRACDHGRTADGRCAAAGGTGAVRREFRARYVRGRAVRLMATRGPVSIHALREETSNAE